MLIYNPAEAEGAIHYTLEAAGAVLNAMGRNFSYDAYFAAKCGLGDIILDAGDDQLKGKLIAFPIGMCRCDKEEYLYLPIPGVFGWNGQAQDAVTMVVSAVIKPGEKYSTDLYEKLTMADLHPKDLSTGEEGLQQIVYMSHLAKVKLLRATISYYLSEPHVEDAGYARRRECIDQAVAAIGNPFGLASP